MVHVARGHLIEAEGVLRNGAAIQDRQIGRGERYPALGLHWLFGLVRLAQGELDDAIAEFERERELAKPHRLYGREYAMHASLGRGAALLKADNRDQAARDFRQALEFYPDHPLGHLGLILAGQGEPGPVEAALDVMDGTKPIEAALIRAQLLAAQGREAQAADVARAAISEAPPGFAGWSIPVEPLLQMTGKAALASVLSLVADRAR